MKRYLRIAGNTEAPCYFTLLEKGYEVKVISCVLISEAGDDCRYEFEASKEGLDYVISACNIYQLLALVVMGETRGFEYPDWKPESEQIESYFSLKHKAPFYDVHGVLIEED